MNDRTSSGLDRRLPVLFTMGFAYSSAVKNVRFAEESTKTAVGVS